MNILVCVKQVPGSNNVKVDVKTGLLIRPRKGNKLNPYDLYAMEEALALKDSMGAKVEVISMGPPQAKDALMECLWMGADGGYLISDRVFGGADVLATSYTISQGIRKAGKADLILCGKQTTDGDTAQVGAEIAEALDIPHVSNVVKIVSLDDKSVTVVANQENLVVTERLQLPCLLSFDSETNTPRLPSYRRKKATTEESLKVLTFADFIDQDASHYGLKGSPTQVQKVFPPEKSNDRVVKEGSSDELSSDILDLLKNKKFI